MFAAAFAAIPSFEMILFGENDVAFRTVVKIFRIKLFVKHRHQRYSIGLFNER